MSKTTKELVAYRKANKLCEDCGKPLDRSTGVLCSKCRDRHNAYERETYKFYQSVGICPKCHRISLIGSEKKCPECRAKDAENSARRAYNRESHSRSNKKRRDRLKSLGICVNCGKNRAEEGHVHCRSCMDRRSLSQRLARNAPLVGERNSRVARGICYRCGKNPILEGRKLCQGCYDSSMANLALTRQINAIKYGTVVLTEK